MIHIVFGRVHYLRQQSVGLQVYRRLRACLQSTVMASKISGNLIVIMYHIFYTNQTLICDT